MSLLTLGYKSAVSALGTLLLLCSYSFCLSVSVSLSLSLSLFFKFKCIYFNWRLITQSLLNHYIGGSQLPGQEGTQAANGTKPVWGDTEARGLTTGL